jgi:NAD(P)-dependent dehydrogenase (short-subunit alcohol dehydrogenase family)
MAGQNPVNYQLPTGQSGYQLYKAAGKLAGKKALITGGDSGIGRAVAILYAMEGAELTIVYIPEEQKDAKKTQELVREKGGQVHLIQADLRSHPVCNNVVEKTIQAMGRINILVLNHGFQMVKNTIAELSEYVIFFLVYGEGRAHDNKGNNGLKPLIPISTLSFPSPNTCSHT